MVFKLLKVVLLLSLASCDIEIDNRDTSGVARAGIYKGPITATGGMPEGAIAIITSTDQVAVVNIDTKESFIGTRVDNELTGTLYATTAVASTAEITSATSNAISGAYDSELGGGTFALNTTGLYERTSELSKLSGRWIDTVYTVALGLGASTWDINSNGAFVITTSTCSGFGNIAIINATKNEYTLTMNISTCDEFAGDYEGFAVLSDTNTVDDTLSLIFSNGTYGGMAQPIK